MSDLVPFDTRQPTLYQRLRARADEAPDALALQCGARRLNRAQLIALADVQADAWLADGLGAGQFIGWLGHNSPEMLAALLACSRLGAVWVPLNWRLAAPELATIARHAGLAALQHTPELAPLAAQLLALAPITECRAAARPAPAGDAMLVYTSGSSGQPKGAVHTQAGMLANIDMALAVQGLTADDRVLAVLPLFHVGGLCIQVLPALAVGAAVNLHPRFDAAAWLAEVAAWRASTSLLVPAVMRALLDHPAWGPADLSSLRFVNSGSQIVPLALIQAFHARGVPVAQVYGSTETGPVSVALHPDQALARAGQAGRPAPGVRLRRVDTTGREVGAGEVGEIQLQAPNLLRAYHRQPVEAGRVDGWFATGDLAVADVDGWLTVVGRSSELIISGGENILPDEIEQLAARWPGVAEAAVLGLPDARWGEVPALALVAQPGVAPDLDGLRQHLASQLARFKQPQRTVLLPTLPRTALGKVQKAALRSLLMAPVTGA